jgi:hypothetical protein
LWLTAFCWTKSLLCNDAFYTELFIQSLPSVMSFKKTLCKIQNSVVQFPCIRPNDVEFRPGIHMSKHHPSKWQDLSVRTFLCREASNFSRLHPSGRLSNTSERLSVFDKLKDFFSKTQIWEDSCNHPDNVAISSWHYPCQGKSCRRCSTVRTSDSMVQTLRP